MSKKNQALGIDNIGPGEVFVADCPKNLLSEHDRAVKLNMEWERDLEELDRRRETILAMLTLWWDKVAKINERAETAKARGLSLGIRMRDGIPVIVEFKATACDCLLCKVMRGEAPSCLEIRPGPEVGGGKDGRPTDASA